MEHIFDPRGWAHYEETATITTEAEAPAAPEFKVNLENWRAQYNRLQRLAVVYANVGDYEAAAQAQARIEAIEAAVIA